MAPPAIDVKKPNLKRTRNSLEKLESIGKNPENKSAAQGIRKQRNVNFQMIYNNLYF